MNILSIYILIWVTIQISYHILSILLVFWMWKQPWEVPFDPPRPGSWDSDALEDEEAEDFSTDAATWTQGHLPMPCRYQVGEAIDPNDEAILMLKKDVQS